MKKVILCFALVATGIFMPKLNAQDNPDEGQKIFKKVLPEKKSSKTEEQDKKDYEYSKERKIGGLEQEKEDIAETEKFELKNKIAEIDGQLEKGEISSEKAQALKQEAAKRAAENIDNKTAIVENQIALIKRDVDYNFKPYTGSYIGVGLGNAYDDAGSFLLGVQFNAENKKLKYDKRTSSDIVLASGYGNMAGNPYKFWKNTYTEVGFTFRTRMLKNSNAVRLVYGVSYQRNMFTFNDNQYMVNKDGRSNLEVFPVHLKKNSYFGVNKIVVPFFFEFGPSKKKEYKDYFRYRTANSFKVGVGAFAGATVSTVQVLRYEEDGNTVNIKKRTDYNANPFVYGLNAYVGVGAISLFARYELNNTFKNSDVKSNVINFGFRIDL